MKSPYYRWWLQGRNTVNGLTAGRYKCLDVGMSVAAGGLGSYTPVGNCGGAGGFMRSAATSRSVYACSGRIRSLHG